VIILLCLISVPLLLMATGTMNPALGKLLLNRKRPTRKPRIPTSGATAFYQDRTEPQGLLDFLQRYRDPMLAVFSFGGTVWAMFHFLAGRWRSRPLVRRLRDSAHDGHIYEMEHEASHLFATGRINKDAYEAVKESNHHFLADGND
jgi:hypothetical protein